MILRALTAPGLTTRLPTMSNLPTPKGRRAARPNVTNLAQYPYARSRYPGPEGFGVSAVCATLGVGSERKRQSNSTGSIGRRSRQSASAERTLLSKGFQQLAC